MKQKNKFYVLKSNTDSTLSIYSYNTLTGESQTVVDTYGFPNPVYLTGSKANKHYKPVFIPASDIQYSNIEVICYDRNENYIGYKVDSYRYTQGKKLFELPAGTFKILVNFNTPAEDYSKSPSRIWFYVGYEVTPHYKKLELQNKKESNQMFFRESLNGTVKLHGDDYQFVNTASLEQDLLLAIYNSQDTIIAKNKFNKTDCKYDHARSMVQLKLSPEDIYSQVLDKYENSYDIIKLSPAITRLTLTKRMAYQIYIAGANNITTVANGTYWEEDVNEPIYDLRKLQDEYYFAKISDSFFEVHLEGFNYDINATYIVDPSSDTWNATSKVTVWINGQQHTYLVQACIKFEKKYDAGSTAFKQIQNYAYGISDGEIIDEEHLFNGDNVLYDINKICIFTGPNGTGNKIYESGYFAKDSGNFLIAQAPGKYMLYKIDQPIPQKIPEPESFSLGDNVIEYGVCARIVCDIDKVTIGGTEYTLYDLPSDDFVYNRANYKKCRGLIGLTLHQTRATSSKPTKYGMDDYGDYFTSNFLNPYTDLFYGKPIPVSRSAWANTSIWVTFNDSWRDFEAKFRLEYILKDAYSLADVISTMLKEIDPRLKHEGTSEYSQFLYSGTSPLSFDTARNGYKVYITPKSNVLKGNYDQAAQKAELSFEQLMDMLRNCFRCYWFIDEYNRFRIEHISYFLKGMSYTNPTSQFNLTQELDKFNKKAALYCQKENEFDKSDLSSRYEFDWMDDCTDAFGNNSIDVISKYIQKDKTESINADAFSSDVDLMLYAPDKFTSDGFALLIARASDGKVPIVNVTTLKDDEYIGPLGDGQYSANPQNYLASWLYLMRYYMYDMPAYSIKYDGIISIDAMRVVGIKRCMKHNIEFPSNTINIDIQRLITTDFGNGYIEEMSTNIDTEMTKMELRYVPD